MLVVEAEEKIEVESESSPRAVIIIPARMASKRLPGKPLMMAGGKSLVHWTYLQAMKTICKRVLVATPDREIASHCREQGIPWRPTSDQHPNGTHRCWEAFSQMRDDAGIELIVNWQVDAVSVDPDDANRMLRLGGELSTLVHPLCSRMEDRNQTKVVHSSGRCHWFMRNPFPNAGSHIGVYAYSPRMLRELQNYSATEYARMEGLEQLTWIEQGHRIAPVKVDHDAREINSEEDWAWFRQLKETDQ